MCGIILYKGIYPIENCKNALKNLSYRGYDSWGFFLQDTKYQRKSIDKNHLYDKEVDLESGTILGHTRWATHGPVIVSNCQPFYDEEVDFGLVHNGIIDIDFDNSIGYFDLDNYKNYSDTKKLFDYICYGLKHSIKHDDPNEWYISKRPINILSKQKGDNAFIAYLKGKYYAVLTGNKILYHYNNIVTSDLCNIQVPPHIRDQNLIILDSKQRYYEIDLDKNLKHEIACIHTDRHAMYSEIFEQDTLQETKLYNILLHKNVVLFGCGSSYNAALYLSYQKDNIQAYHASELKYKINSLNKDSIFIGITQSGETKDVIDVIEELTRFKRPVYIVTNNKDSIAAKMCQYTELGVGPEYGVAATKTFMATTRLIGDSYRENNIEDLSIFVKRLVDDNDFRNYIFLGEGENYPLALEAALKLKEVAQVWTDAMPAGEIKHGPISCVDDKTLVIVLMNSLTRDINNNIQQVKSKGAKVLSFNSPGIDFSIYSQNSTKCNNIIGPQLLAYWTAIKLGLDPDKPRGICKAVTV